MQPVKTEDIAEDLKDWAEQFVGKVGTDGVTSIGPTGEPYVTFSWYLNDEDDLRLTFKEWIGIYLEFVNSARNTRRNKAVLYWRRYPTYESVGNIIIRLSARLLISRDNHRIEASNGTPDRA